MELTLKLALIGLFGACGALCRYGLSLLCARLFGLGFPYGTALSNVVGCFLFGVVVSLADSRALISPELRGLLLVGFMGAFTTFSSLIFDSYSLYEGEQIGLAFLNIAGQILLGLAALCLGLRLASQL